MSFRLATRGSPLALRQTAIIAARLAVLEPGLRVETVVIKTTGDRWLGQWTNDAPGKGVFVKEIEQALLEGRADAAVHSLKDMPTEDTAGLVIAAVPEREDPRDCVVSRFGEQLFELPRGATVGTGSPRRAAQVKRINPRARVEPIRGNIDTRLAKVSNGEVDAVILAYAALRRLGLTDEVSELLEPDVFLPAPGQGCLALQTRAHGDARALAARLDHAPSSRAAEAERSFLSALGGGCRVPIAAYAVERGGQLDLTGMVASADGASFFRDKKIGSDPRVVGRALAEALLYQGAGDCLKASVPGPDEN